VRQVSNDPVDIAKLDELLVLMGGLDRLMATLVQVLTMDSFHYFTRMTLDFVWWSWIYFYAYVAVAVVVLMNLVTAIIVENAMETSKADQDHVANEMEAKRKKDMSSLKRLFRSMDKDGGGTLSWDEFSHSFEDPDMSRYWKSLDFQPEDCIELFHLLDDGDGEITTTEFLDALFRMSRSVNSKDIFKLQKGLEKITGTVDSVAARLRMLSVPAPAATGANSPLQPSPTKETSPRISVIGGVPSPRSGRTSLSPRLPSKETA